jgi:hypothetical protein
MKLTTALGALLICDAAAAGYVHPIVEVQSGYLFGATASGKWMKAKRAAKGLPGETYQVYGLTQSFGQAKGGKPKPSEEDVCSDVLTVSLSPKPEKGVIALAAPWNALPRKPLVVDATQSVYVEAVRDFLKARGITEPKVRINRIVRVDLEGDGEDDVLISATNYFTKDNEAPMHSPRRGSYSIVILRRVVSGKVQTRLVAGEVYAKADASNAPNLYSIAAVLDLNGDGKLEVVVHSFYYEGSETTIYRCEPNRIEAVLSVECGA